MRNTTCLVAALVFSTTALADSTAPFGLEIGKASCNEAEQRLGSRVSEGGFIEAPYPSEIYPNATRVAAVCWDGIVQSVILTAPKGNLDNALALQTFRELQKQYTLVEGHTPLALQDSYAEFIGPGNVTIRMTVPHLDFNFYLIYRSSASQSAWLNYQKEQHKMEETKRSAL